MDPIGRFVEYLRHQSYVVGVLCAAAFGAVAGVALPLYVYLERLFGLGEVYGLGFVDILFVVSLCHLPAAVLGAICSGVFGAIFGRIYRKKAEESGGQDRTLVGVVFGALIGAVISFTMSACPALILVFPG